jgi:hypothetical protein
LRNRQFLPVHMSSFTSNSVRIRSCRSRYEFLRIHVRIWIQLKVLDSTGSLSVSTGIRARLRCGEWRLIIYYFIYTYLFFTLCTLVCVFWCCAVVYKCSSPVLPLVQVIGGDGLAREAHRAILSRLRQQNTQAKPELDKY